MYQIKKNFSVSDALTILFGIVLILALFLCDYYLHPFQVFRVQRIATVKNRELQILNFYPFAVLQVNVSYASQKAPSMSLSSVVVRSLKTPFRYVYDPGVVSIGTPVPLTIEVDDKDKKQLFSKKYYVETSLSNEAGYFNSNKHDAAIKLDNFTTPYFIPYYEKAKTVVIKDSRGKIIGQKTIKDTRFEVGVVTSQQISDTGKTIQIGVVSAEYSSSQMSVFHADADRVKAVFFATAPFSTYSSNFNMTYIDNTDDLGCKRYKAPPTYDTRTLGCDKQKAFDAALKTGKSYDVLIVIANESDYGGGGYPGLVAFAKGSPPSVAVHEFGHSFGALLDEYSYGSDQPFDQATHANCYAGTPPTTDSLWLAATPAVKYVKECSSSNWYRSTESSIMRDVFSVNFNAVSADLLKQKIGVYSGNPIITPPSEGILPNPIVHDPIAQPPASGGSVPCEGSSGPAYNSCGNDQYGNLGACNGGWRYANDGQKNNWCQTNAGGSKAYCYKCVVSTPISPAASCPDTNSAGTKNTCATSCASSQSDQGDQAANACTTFYGSVLRCCDTKATTPLCQQGKICSLPGGGNKTLQSKPSLQCAGCGGWCVDTGDAGADNGRCFDQP